MSQQRYHRLISDDIEEWYREKSFTSDWFSHNTLHWVPLMLPWREREIEILEIGSYEGRSAIFFLEFFKNSHVVCVDLFEAPAGRPFVPEFETRFDANLVGYGDRFEKLKGRSVPVLDSLRASGRRFDLIYIDGSHKRLDVFADSILSWGLLKVGGMLIWDDYSLRRGKAPSEDRPEHAIDLFCAAFKPCLRIRHRLQQVVIEKSSEWPRERMPRRIALWPVRRYQMLVSRGLRRQGRGG